MHRLEPLQPLGGRQDGLLLPLLPGDVVPVLVGVVQELLDHVRVDALGDVEQAVAVALLALAVLVWEELGHIGEAHELAVQGFDGDLVVLLDGDHLDRGELH